LVLGFSHKCQKTLLREEAAQGHPARIMGETKLPLAAYRLLKP